MVAPPRRITRVIGYALMAIAGVAAIIWPAPSVRAATSPTTGLLVYVWAILLAVGGISATIGAATDRWLGEYVGLIPLVTTFAAYGLAAWARADWTSIAGGCALMSIAMLLLARWRDVAVVAREAARRAQLRP